MATIVVSKKGRIDIEKGLERMDWDTEKFETELEMFAKAQPPEVQEQLRKQYNTYMNRCGWPMEIIVVTESPKKLPKETKSEPEIQSSPQTTALATVAPTQIPVNQEPNEPEKTEAPIPIAVQEPIPQETKHGEAETKTPERKELHGYIVMNDALQVKNLLKTINVLVDEATFKLTPKGLTLRCMDPSRVAMIDLVIPREDCTEHSCNEEIKFCFSIQRYLDPTLKNITKNDALRLDVKTGTVDKMITRLSGKLTRQFSMPLLEVSDEEMPIPKITFNHSARLVLENLNTLFKDLDDHVRIIGNQDSLTFEQTGDIETLTTTLQKGDETVLNIEAKEETKATYSVSYLGKLLKALNLLTDIVEISYSTDMPIRISAELEHLGTVNFWIAPRVESD